MAVAVGTGPSFGVPKPLFQTRVPGGVDYLRTHYAVTPDGQRFLVNMQLGDPPPNPITVVLNWTAALKKMSRPVCLSTTEISRKKGTRSKSGGLRTGALWNRLSAEDLR